ncbi:uncharacterized protein LACBIDRAFT_316142 [Laccaria bicolor S238N-H82]|uniref:Predicted protein n=1 Tax=Laccaria bicolor (strain S238N-H82 / ATCC MYA-4686) TaxID=486041 RepID=B0D235_LACBS|nr:uncharacterized protein LACBIDRAFT_316142 [Laccaria bicolor S238N-H82]EDR11033.1 predicted protein [Laccaria bicolor S238N-H82]|eukprot:XP_001878334.1 predicted protein [Laccaria bicolor S238N-H82]
MTDVSAEATRQRAQAFETIISDVMDRRSPLSEFGKRLQDAGASPAEAEDYLQQLAQRIEQQRKDKDAEGQSETQSSEQAVRESTPEGLEEAEAVEFHARREALLEEVRVREAADRRTAVDTAAWAVLNAKLSHLAGSQASNKATTLLSADDLAKLLGVKRSAPQSLPASVLTLAPHLAELSTSSISDPHIEETWKLRQAIGTDKTIDSLVNLMQVQPLTDPIPRSIWRLVIQDHFVDFEKLFASMDKGYDHNDEPHDFGGGYALIKKEQASAKRPLRSESEWARVFGAWSSAVVLVYRHRSSELQGYQCMVTDLFRAVPHDPSIAIAFDVEARDRYAKSPFRMDDRTQLNVPLLARMFQGSGPSSKKRGNPVALSSPPSKRSSIPCQNWNMGICDAPCPNGRKHGICCECEGQHRAKDEPVCNTLLQARQRKGISGGYSESGKGKGRA